MPEHFSLHNDPKLTIHYLRWGNGPKVLLALHGYGLDGSCFLHLDFLHNEYTVYSFHLPYHGGSTWEGKTPLSPALWYDYIREWKQAHKIERYDVLGFSMGGKFALSVVDFDAKNIDRLILIAPDGVKRNFWYRLATHNFLTRGLFKLLVGKSSYFYTLSNMMGKLKLLPKITVKFAQKQMTTPKDRERGFLVWTNFRFLHTNLNTRLKTITENSIQVKLFTGIHDRVILRKDVAGLSKLPEELFEWKEFDCGHTHILRYVKF